MTFLSLCFGVLLEQTAIHENNRLEQEHRLRTHCHHLNIVAFKNW